jgi:hypothetical protein
MVSQLRSRSSLIQCRIWSLNGSNLDVRVGRGAASGVPRKYLRTVFRAIPVSAAIVRIE